MSEKEGGVLAEGAGVEPDPVKDEPRSRRAGDQSPITFRGVLNGGRGRENRTPKPFRVVRFRGGCRRLSACSSMSVVGHSRDLETASTPSGPDAVAVRADNLAPSHFLDNARHRHVLIDEKPDWYAMAVDVVEVHRTWRKHSAAIGTWPLLLLLCELSQALAKLVSTLSFPKSSACPDAVTVRTDQLTQRDFAIDRFL